MTFVFDCPKCGEGEIYFSSSSDTETTKCRVCGAIWKIKIELEEVKIDGIL